ncbi:TOBE domain-containing protein [Prauserella rugosa]|nr:TOBE domain-containing protein [Prauserella rugosa]KMS84362.1 MerR family transcriptional regulator [Streptomyces regensis]
MPQFRFSEAARLMGVSDDTIRRWVRSGHLDAGEDSAGRKVVDGAELAAFARRQAVKSSEEDRTAESADPTAVGRSARNRFVGLVTNVVADTVMAQVEVQCGPHRVVSLMSSEAVEELGLRPGALAVAVVKATQVIVETPGGTR